MYTTGICGAAIHCTFIGLFLLLNVNLMALVNVLSTLCWILITLLAVNSKTGFAAHLAIIEVVIHAILATVLLGTDLGFHFYLWPICLIMALNGTLGIIPSAILSTLAIGAFSALSTLIEIDLSDRYSAGVIFGINLFNMLAAGLSMILTGTLVRHMFSQQRLILQQYADTDELTGLYNRRHMLEFLRHTEANRHRNKQPYCVCICDLDNFKAINDVYGHDAGDIVLVSFAKFLSQSIRASDSVARWGGEEFLLVLSNTDGHSANDTINLLLQRLRTDKQIEIKPGHRLSMSVGIAEASDAVTIDELIIHSDNALYKAKDEGRDRAVFYNPSL